MVPVATLPAAAILMGVGYWIDPVGWGGDNALAALFIKSGSAIIDHMAVLFAIGVAYGMSKDKDGSAALTGFVGFLVLTTLCSPAAVSMIQKIPSIRCLPRSAKLKTSSSVFWWGSSPPKCITASAASSCLRRCRSSAAAAWCRSSFPS